MAVKASALPPAYAEGQQVYEFSVDLAGGLRMSGGGGGGGGTVDQGAPAIAANAWPVKLSDGVNSPAIKNAAPAAADYGLVGRVLLYDSNGNPLVVTAGRLVVDGSGVTQPVSNAGLANLDVALSTRTKPADSQLVGAPVGTPVFVRLSDGAATLIGQKAMAASLPVVVASDQTVIPISDNAGSLTVDAPVGTPAFVRLSDGAAALVGQKVMASSLPVVVASDQSALTVNGDVDHDVANTLKNIQIAGHASPVDVPPAAVSANADRVRAHFDRYGAVVVRRRKIRESYTAVCRLAEAAARLDQTFTQVANTNKQWATLHHTVAASTKEVRLQKCVAYITADTTVGIQGVFELRQISAAPATGNPAITPTPHRRGGTAAEAVCLYLPTTAGTEANVNSPLGHVPFDTGISGVVSTVNPVPILVPIVLYDASAEDDEVLPPSLPVGTLDGWAAVLRTVGAPVLRITIVWKFTEEIP